MKVSGSHVLDHPRDRVWEAIQDPAVLARTIPGCQALEVTGDDVYAVTVRAGVASITGTYLGEVKLTDKHAPEGLRLHASGQGGPGTIHAQVGVRLLEEDGGGATRIEYDADAVVGGAIAGVGQRVLQGVSKRNAQEFFTAIERELSGLTVPPAPGAPTPRAEEREPAEVGRRPEIGEVFAGRPRPAGGLQAGGLVPILVAAAVGAAIALIGVLVGRRIGRG